MPGDEAFLKIGTSANDLVILQNVKRLEPAIDPLKTFDLGDEVIPLASSVGMSSAAVGGTLRCVNFALPKTAGGRQTFQRVIT